VTLFGWNRGRARAFFHEGDVIHIRGGCRGERGGIGMCCGGSVAGRW